VIMQAALVRSPSCSLSSQHGGSAAKAGSTWDHTSMLHGCRQLLSAQFALAALVDVVNTGQESALLAGHTGRAGNG